MNNKRRKLAISSNLNCLKDCKVQIQQSPLCLLLGSHDFIVYHDRLHLTGIASINLGNSLPRYLGNEKEDRT